MREPGIYENIDIDVYHSEEGISSSGIKLILDCPKRYHFEYIENKKELLRPEEIDHFIVGRALHISLLEPEKFNDSFHVITENYDLRTTLGKEKHKALLQSIGSKSTIKNDEMIHINNMVSRIHEHPIWNFIKDGKVENSIYWNSGIYNTRLKSRPDVYTDQLIVDIKTTNHIPKFKNSIYEYGYHRQAAMQIDGLRHFNKAGDFSERFFAFLVIEKKPPYLIGAFTLDEESIEQGRREYKDAAAIYSECLKYNHWPEYDSNFKLISIPKYRISQLETFI